MSDSEDRTIETGTRELLALVRAQVAIVTLNRPEARNALSDEMSPALRRLLPELAKDPDVRCLLLTGAGNAFCAGGDVKGMSSAGHTKTEVRPPTRQERIDDLRDRQISLTGALYDFPKPTLAALPGPAAGAGLSIALACDLRIAASSAFITTAFANIGLSGDYGASFFLTQLVGTARAREFFFGAQRLGAARCCELGIVNRVVPDDELRDAAFEWARTLATGPTVAFGIMKKNLDRALRSDLHECLAHEAAGLMESATTKDHRNAVQAFIQKQKPEFEGS